MSTSRGSRDYGRFDELAEEFAQRFRRGERPNLQEYIDRLPEMADEIREMFPALVEVERAEGDMRSQSSPGSPAPMPAPRLRQIGDYRLLREVGRGGMGVVYEAEQISLGRRVALKVLPGHITGDRKALERFRREAKAAARLHHTNIVPVFEVGRDGEAAFYAMQFIQGQGLDQVIDELVRLRDPDRESPAGEDLRPAGSHKEAAPIGMATGAVESGPRKNELGRVAETLLCGRLTIDGLELGPDPSAAGEGAILSASSGAPTERFDPDATSGFASCDMTLDQSEVQPASDVSRSAILPGGAQISAVDVSGRRQPFFQSVAQIGRQTAQGLDYAHARGIVHRDVKPSNLLLDTAGIVWITDFGLAKTEDDGLTQTGDILGTLRYMAPERFRGEGDARADIYALGLTLYELLTLRPAYDASDRLKLIERIKAQEPTRPRSIDSRVPRDLETIILKAIEKDPDRRYATAGAMAEDLRRFLADEPILARQASAAERYWRWARHHPTIAVLGAILTGVLILATVGSLLAAGIFARQAERQRGLALGERLARQEISRQAKAEAAARTAADEARKEAQAETYRAMLSEVKALRAGHQLGWRDDALDNLAQLSVMPAPRRDLVELRSQAVASIGEFDIVEVARLKGMSNAISSLDFSPDSATLATTSTNGHLQLWDVERRRHAWQADDPAGRDRRFGWPEAGDPIIRVRFLPDGSLARTTWSHGVEFLESSGRPSPRPLIAGESVQAVGLEVGLEGRRLAVGWDDGRIDLYDTGTCALSRTIPGNPFVFDLSPDGRWLALTGPNNSVQIQPLDADGPAITLGQCRDPVTALAFSPDSATLASSSDRITTLWDMALREERLGLRGHKELVTGIAFSPDGNWVGTTSQDYTARIWDARTGQMLAVLPGLGMIKALAFSQDGQYLAVAGSDQSTSEPSVNLYKLQGRRERRLLAGHTRGTQCLAFHPRLPLLASGADDHAVIVWDAESARPLRHLANLGVYVGAVAYSPDGTLLASGLGTGGEHAGDIGLWDAQTGSLRGLLSGHTIGVHALAFDPTGQRLASGDESGNLILWDVATGQILRRESVGPSWIWSIAFFDEGRHLVTEVSGGPIVVYDLEGAEPSRRVAVPGGMRRFVVDRARDDVIVAGHGGILTRVSLRNLSLGHHLDKGHDGKIESLALSPDGRLLVTGGGADRRIVFRDAESFEPLLTLPVWTGMVKDLAFDGTGRWLAIAGADSDVGLWDLGLVRGELAAVGLAWDQPLPATASADGLAHDRAAPSAEVVVILPESSNPAEFEKAQGLLNSGRAAFQQGRFAGAVVDLQQASGQLQAMRKSRPIDPLLARLHGNSLGILASALRDSKQPAEALVRAQESLAVYESLNQPSPGDLYNMACVSAMMSALNDQGSAEDREELQSRAVSYLGRAIKGDPDDGILAMISGDLDLDPLRDRPDFRALILDHGFPSDPFATTAAAPSATQALDRAIAARPEDPGLWFERGDARARRGDWKAALADFREGLARDPSNTIHWMQAAILHLQLGDVEGYRRQARAMLDTFGSTNDPMTAERTAKIGLLTAPPPEDGARLTALAELAVTRGAGAGLFPWYQFARGMAAYRDGQLELATDLLRAADEANTNGQINTAVKLYWSMAEARLTHGDSARALFDSACRALDEIAPSASDLGPGWLDWLICQLALREAEAVLGQIPSLPPPVGPPASDH